MNVVLDNRETTHGSFKVWGTGFRYDYNNDKKALTVFHQDSERLLAQFGFDNHLSKRPLEYINLLEKASQVNALMMSNNRTVNLAETMELKYLSPIIHSIGSLSRQAFDLQNLNLSRFCHIFTEEYNLKSMKIKPFKSRGNDHAFFIAYMQTHHENGISVRACTMEGIMAGMSDKTLRDLMTMEFGHRYEGSAQNLLKVSSKFSSLSYILDDDFVPKMKVFSANTDKIDSINRHTSH